MIFVTAAFSSKCFSLRWLSHNCFSSITICDLISGAGFEDFTSFNIFFFIIFNALILSRLDYCSQLWSPNLIRHIIQIEKVQHSFTKFITGMRDCSYSDRLSLLRLYSLQRRRERYCIIYAWKIIEEVVPNFSKPIVCTHSECRRRYCSK